MIIKIRAGERVRKEQWGEPGDGKRRGGGGRGGERPGEEARQKGGEGWRGAGRTRKGGKVEAQARQVHKGQREVGGRKKNNAGPESPEGRGRGMVGEKGWGEKRES
jgi:hypothetical protein